MLLLYFKDFIFIPEKELRFVGIVIDRGGTGLRAWIVIRNVIEGMGIEFMYDLYSPTLKDIEVLRLEKRLDEELYYLRDCDPKYSTVPMDMTAELLPEDSAVPINDVVIPLKPYGPWSKNWQRFNDRLVGYTFDKEQIPYKQKKHEEGLKAHLNIVSKAYSAFRVSRLFSKPKQALLIDNGF